MKINVSSQLMLNQRYSHTLEPDKTFKVLQTQEGNALFFSIGFDNKFYLTRETPADTHGWSRTDIGTPVLAEAFPDQAATVKLFDISQDLLMGQTTIIMVATVNGADHFFYAVNADNSDAGWAAYSFNWTLFAFDDAANAAFATMPISDIYLGQSGLTTYIIADIVTNAAASTISRYFIDPTKKVSGKNTAWNPHPLPGDLQSQKVTTAIGRLKTNDKVNGVYTLGSLISDEQICYVPVYNDIQRGVAVSPTYINLPAGAAPAATAMALSRPDPSQPYTDLFIVTNGSLYFISAAAQATGAQPVLVSTNALLQNVQQLHVNNGDGHVSVWGHNGNKQIFYLQCATGSEANASAWSAPIPLLDNVVTVSTFVNNALNNLVIFAHQLQGGTEELLQLTQDPVSTNWQARNLLVPAISIDDMYEETTYTTHVAFTDDNGAALPLTQASITAINPCSVYIENAYYKLDTENPVTVTTDASGMLTIMQPVDGLGAASYTLTSGGISVDINPMQCVQDKLGAVTSGSDLDVTLTDENGTSSSLVDSSVSSDDKNAAASMIHQLAATLGTMPVKSPETPVAAALAAAGTPKSVPFDPAKHRVYAISLKKGSRRFYQGLDQVAALGVVHNADNTLALKAANLGSAVSRIETTVGDIGQWFKEKRDEVSSWIISVAEDAVDFLVTVDDLIYHFVAQCYQDVVQAIHSLMVILESTWDKIRQWVGFIFGWTDIVNTHKVFKNLLLTYAQKSVAAIADLNNDIQKAFSSLETDIDNWAGMPNSSDSFSSLTGSANPNVINDPTSNWAMNHVKNNAAGSTLATVLPDQSYTDDVMTVLGDVEQLLLGFKDNFENSVTQVQQLISDMPNLSRGDVLKRLVDIVTNELLKDCQQVINLIMTIIEQMVQGAVDALNAEIDFPIISRLYKKYAGDPLSMLDVTCLVLAIPMTIIYKMANNAAPFPADDPVTLQLINAPDFAAIQAMCAPQTTPAASPAAAGVYNPEASGIDGLGVPLLKKLVMYSAYAGAIGGVLIAIFGPLKIQFPDNPLVASLGSLSYLPYVAPDIAGSLKPILQFKWYAVFSAACTGLGVLKACIDIASAKGNKSDWYAKYCDNTSGWLDFALNLSWQAPTIGAVCYAENQNKAGWLAFGGGTGFDLSGMLSPFMNKYKGNPVAFSTLVAVNAVANAAWSACTVASYYETDWDSF